MEFKNKDLTKFKRAVADVDKVCNTFNKDHVEPIEKQINELKAEYEALNNKVEAIKTEGMKDAKGIQEFTNNKARIRELTNLIPALEEDLREIVESGKLLRTNLLTKVKNDSLEALKKEFMDNMLEAQYQFYCLMAEAEKINKETMELEELLKGETHILAEIGVDTFYSFAGTPYKTAITNSFSMRDMPRLNQYNPPAPDHVVKRYNKEKGV